MHDIITKNGDLEPLQDVIDEDMFHDLQLLKESGVRNRMLSKLINVKDATIMRVEIDVSRKPKIFLHAYVRIFTDETDDEEAEEKEAEESTTQSSASATKARKTIVDIGLSAHIGDHYNMHDDIVVINDVKWKLIYITV